MLASPGPDQISPANLRSTVEKLASWNTRNTNTPELTEAANWIAEQYRKIPGLQVEIWSYTIVKGRRVPEDKTVVQVIAKLPGETDRMVMVGGHFDTVNMEPDADIFKSRAPGANDDASGVALALEIARVMSAKKWRNTLVFCAFSGEEQGLLGSRALAKRATQESWKIDAVLSNDMVGNSKNLNGQSDNHHVRLFSDESATHNSRELARYIEWITRKKIKGADVKLVFRKDRYGRGGDHTPFNEEGFSAVRFVEMHEEYSRQHTEKDIPKDMDWEYLANNARLNLLAMSSLAQAMDPPTDVRIDLKQGHDTTLTWQATPGVKYVIYWRETTSPVWQSSRAVGTENHATIAKVSKDDFVFAVGAENGTPVVAK